MKLRKLFVISLIGLLLFNMAVTFHVQKLGKEFSEKLRIHDFYSEENYYEREQLEEATILSIMSQNCRDKLETYSYIIKKYYEIAEDKNERFMLNSFINKIQNMWNMEINIFDKKYLNLYFDKGINKNEILRVLEEKNEISYEKFEYKRWSFIKYLKLDDEKILFIRFFFFPKKMVSFYDEPVKKIENYDEMVLYNFNYAIIAALGLGLIFIILISFLVYKSYELNGALKSFLPLIFTLVILGSCCFNFQLSKEIIKANAKDYYKDILERHINYITEEEKSMRKNSEMHIKNNDIMMKFIRDETLALCNKLYTSGKADSEEIEKLILYSSTEKCKVDILSKETAHFIMGQLGSKSFIDGNFRFVNNGNYNIETNEDVYNKLVFNKNEFSFDSTFIIKRELIFYYPVIDKYVRISGSLNKYIFNALKYKTQVFDFLNFKSSPSNDSYVIVIDSAGNVISGKDRFYDIDIKTAIDNYSGKKIWESLQLDKGDQFRFLINRMDGALVEVSGIYKYDKDLNLYFIYLIEED